MGDVSKKKRRAFSLEEKMGILAQVDANMGTRVNLAASLGIPVSTLNTIVKNREEIEKSFYRWGAFSKTRKSTKTSAFHEMESILATWFKQAQTANVSIDGSHLKEEALKIASLLGIEDFHASNGWIDRFKKRHNVIYKSICSDGPGVNLEAVNEWKKEVGRLVAGYEAKDIFNADETGLYYNFQLGKSLSQKGDSCDGGTKSRQRLTVLLCCNADGSEKLSPVVIGKFKKPYSFTKLPTKYETSSNSGMTCEIFEEFLVQLDEEMATKGRKILLFVDQCAAHRNLAPDALRNVKLVFFPANCTSHVQPLDSRIIQNFKFHCRKQLLHKAIALINEGLIGDASELKINLFAAMKIVAGAWSRITSETIQNCFKKCGFLGCGGYSVEDADALDIEEMQDWDNMKPELSCNDYPQCDADLDACKAQTLVQVKEEEEEEEEDAGEEDADRVSFFQALQGLETVRKYLQQFHVEDGVLEMCGRLENELYSLTGPERCKQSPPSD